MTIPLKPVIPISDETLAAAEAIAPILGLVAPSITVDLYGFHYIQKNCHDLARLSGWWAEYDNMPEQYRKHFIAGKLALVHSEVSEGLEGFRKNLMDDHLPHRSMLEVELADAVIRIFDIAGALDLDIGGAAIEKLAYNQQRADHKPEARAAEGGKSL
ncbi:hypothetical protein XccvBFoX4_gp61c [Xanthomonas phage FoX4]|uniref:Uncharacterized protein n=1 Tax=Xanthomonas phage FoX4 TaxID=2723900 RepID=A0A858WNC8_9CAUD|nr:pyrophosphatase [Xanthomonas phage FoX4]QJI53015.1 hypothetical protein XccvBFoX4_gp61c [Xanthomonas phage FoX4]